MKKAILLTLAAFTLGAPLHAATSSGKSQPTRGRCIVGMHDLVYRTALEANEEKELISWSVTCTSPVWTMTNGSAVLSMQRLEGGRWRTLASGHAPTVIDAGPGTYRVIAKNGSASRIEFTVRHNRGLG